MDKFDRGALYAVLPDLYQKVCIVVGVSGAVQVVGLIEALYLVELEASGKSVQGFLSEKCKGSPMMSEDMGTMKNWRKRVKNGGQLSKQEQFYYDLAQKGATMIKGVLQKNETAKGSCSRRKPNLTN